LRKRDQLCRRHGFDRIDGVRFVLFRFVSFRYDMIVVGRDWDAMPAEAARKRKHKDTDNFLSR
jgi:hypothetical protein